MIVNFISDASENMIPRLYTYYVTESTYRQFLVNWEEETLSNFQGLCIALCSGTPDVFWRLCSS